MRQEENLLVWRHISCW